MNHQRGLSRQRSPKKKQHLLCREGFTIYCRGCCLRWESDNVKVILRVKGSCFRVSRWLIELSRQHIRHQLKDELDQQLLRSSDEDVPLGDVLERMKKTSIKEGKHRQHPKNNHTRCWDCYSRRCWEISSWHSLAGTTKPIFRTEKLGLQLQECLNVRGFRHWCQKGHLQQLLLQVNTEEVATV